MPKLSSLLHDKKTRYSSLHYHVSASSPRKSEKVFPFLDVASIAPSTACNKFPPYCSLDDDDDAHRSPRQSARLWASSIAYYARSGRPRDSLNAYLSMVDHGLEPDLQSFLILLKACGSIRDLEEGKKLHHHARNRGLASNAFVASSLLSMYGKCGNIKWAETVFQELPDRKRDVIMWNAMLSAYAEQGQDEKTLKLYRQMQEKHMRLDHVTYAVALRACATLAEREEASINHKPTSKAICLEVGRAIHADARRNGLASHVMVASSLACLYGKCGTIMQAENAFGSLAQHNIVTWTAMISAYNEHGQESNALKLYVQMHQEGIYPDQHVFSIVLQACVALAEKEEATLMDGEEVKVVSLILGQSLHIDAARKGFISNVFVSSILVTMYAKCGTLLKAEKVFKEMPQPDLVALTAMLSAYVEQGQASKALKLYKRMQKLGLPLDSTALACVLQASSENGRLDFCRQLHFNSVSAGHDSSRFLENCFVHAYGTCSCLLDARAVFDKLSKPDLISWNACIAGYAQEGNYGACMHMLESMHKTGIKPNEVTFFSVLSVCSHAGHVAKGLECFETMSRDYGICAELKHHAIIMDLLARVGDFSKVMDISERMPLQGGLSLRSSLLGACLKHGNLELGEQLFNYATELQPLDYVLMSNIYADASLKDYA